MITLCAKTQGHYKFNVCVRLMHYLVSTIWKQTNAFSRRGWLDGWKSSAMRLIVFYFLILHESRLRTNSAICVLFIWIMNTENK